MPMALNIGSFKVFPTYFEMPCILLVARLVDLVDANDVPTYVPRLASIS